MKRAKTSTFIAELPLSVNQETERQLQARLLSGTRLYNAALGEALRRLDLMRESKAWKAARRLIDKDRTNAFRELTRTFEFTSASVSSYATSCKNAAGWQSRLSANETQIIAETAFAAAAQYSYGKRGRPRFKAANRPLKSFTGKTNKTGLRYRAELGVVEWAGLIMPIKFSPTGKDAWLDEALTAPTKFCRLVWRRLKGKRRWYIQLAQEGLSPSKEANTTRDGESAGLDVGPSTVAVVTDTACDLLAFCPTIEQPWRKIRTIQRAMDRSQRDSNPHCYRPDGTWKKGAKILVRSKHYVWLQQQLAELERCLAAERKRSHGEYCNDILRFGNQIKSESLSYRAWHKRYGRSVKVKAPGGFMSMLKRKAERAGGNLIDLNTRKLKMSQYDHVSGEYHKKKLSQRWHVLGNITTPDCTLVQRDLYSAWLAYCVIDNSHQSTHLHAQWEVVKPLLKQADWCRKHESASGKPLVFPAVTPSTRRLTDRADCLLKQDPFGYDPEVVVDSDSENCGVDESRNAPNSDVKAPPKKVL